jgi:hypothetical protein
MTYKNTIFQINLNENRNFSPAGGALFIPAIFERFGLRKIIDENIGVRRGNDAIKYKDSAYIESLVTMHILGGEAVDDIKLIREDKVLSKTLGGVPGKTSIHNYISRFVAKEEEEKRGYGKSFVPESNEHLKGFDKITRYLLQHTPHVKSISTVTLDQDATFIPTGVKGSLLCMVR